MTCNNNELDRRFYGPAADAIRQTLGEEPERVLKLRPIDEAVLRHAGHEHAIANAERCVAELQREQRKRERAEKPKERYADVHGVTLFQGQEVER